MLRVYEPVFAITHPWQNFRRTHLRFPLRVCVDPLPSFKVPLLRTAARITDRCGGNLAAITEGEYTDGASAA